MPGQQDDVANSGLGSFAGKPMIHGSITCSLMPNGIQMGKMYERNPFPATAMDPSGLNVKFGKTGPHERFNHSITLT